MKTYRIRKLRRTLWDHCPCYVERQLILGAMYAGTTRRDSGELALANSLISHQEGQCHARATLDWIRRLDWSKREMTRG